MAEYVLKVQKGDIEIELRSDDPEFIQSQLDSWRALFLGEDN